MRLGLFCHCCWGPALLTSAALRVPSNASSLCTTASFRDKRLSWQAALTQAGPLLHVVCLVVNLLLLHTGSGCR